MGSDVVTDISEVFLNRSETNSKLSYLGEVIGDDVLEDPSSLRGTSIEMGSELTIFERLIFPELDLPIFFFLGQIE